MTTERAGVEVGGDSKEAVRELEQLKDKAVQVSQSLGSMAKEAALTGLAVVGLDNVVAVLQRTVEFASASLAAFAETSHSTGQSVRVASEAMRSLQVSLGSAVLGGGNAQIVMQGLTQALGAMSSQAIQNQDDLQALSREGFAALADAASITVDAVSAANVAFVEARNAVTILNESMLFAARNVPFVSLLDDIATAVGVVERDTERYSRRLAENAARTDDARQSSERLANATSGVSSVFARLADDLRNNRQSVDQFIDSTDDAIRRYGVLSALFGNASQAPPPPPPPPRVQTLAPEEVEYEVEDLIRVFRESYHAFTDSTVEAYKERGTAAAEAQAEVAQQLALKEEEQAAAAQARAQANADKLISIEQYALERRKAIAGETAGLTASLVGELAAGEEKALDVIKRFLGQELMAKGQALAIEGGATLAFSPVGAIKLAAGLGMVAAGARMARTGGGGSGTAVESGAAPIPAATTPAPSTTMTQQVSFGIVGDPRAAAALVADSTRTAMREGFRGAA